MKKICYVVTIPLTIRAFFIPQLRYLSDNGFDVTVVCGDDGIIAKELGSGIHFHGVDMPRGVSFFSSIKAVSQLKSFFKEQKFDLIQYSTPNAALYASIAAKAAGCKVRNYHLMGNRFLGSKGIGKQILKLMDKTACRLSTSIECVSRSNLELGAREGVYPKEKANVVWNGSSGGVDLKRFDISKREGWRSSLRGELGYSEDDFVFGFAGRITRDKGMNELLQAFFELNDDSKLFIIGYEDAGTLDPVLWKNALDSPRVKIHSPTGEIEKYYALFDVLVLPSYREGFGNVVIEAAAMGTPAVISDIPGPIDAVIPGKTALTVKPKDVRELAAAMKKIRSEDVSQMGADAARFAKSSFDSTVLLEKILERKNTLLNIT